ncbi:hypothetical protein F4777DRAFT_292164 [Nemania sp. FL0916]|nr:hypothetical protein F4777DRAFT_292164 [Nemania sp. FL0916]
MTEPAPTVKVSPVVQSPHSFHPPKPKTKPVPFTSPHSSIQAGQASSSSSRTPRSPPSWTDRSLPDLPAYAVPAVDFDLGAPVDFGSTLTLVPDLATEHTNELSASAHNRHSFGGSRSRAEIMVKRRSSVLSRSQSWMPSSKSTGDLEYLSFAATEDALGSRASNAPVAPGSVAQDESKGVSDSFASFARRSWISTSRSPSPAPLPSPSPSSNTTQDVSRPSAERVGRERAPSNSSIMKLRKGSRNRSGSSSSESSRSNESLSRFGSYLNRIKTRPQTVRAKGTVPNELESSASSTTSLAPPSTETRKSHASETSNSTFPDDATAPGFSTAARDPLWSAFKSLEADFQRFQPKSTSLKMNLVRTSLVPFLRKYGSHASNLNLHHEDLERRAIILNKWWTGLLEMLHPRTHPVVPGVDRPTLFDAVSTIMMRPEWRQCTPAFRPLAERNPRERICRRSDPESNGSTSSFHSTDSAYLAESTGHNIRTMFTTNLVSQMAFVVEKMSLRHAPAYLIGFAGKACAYAFFFAPGVADVLVRLWSLAPNALRHIADEFKLPRRNNSESEDIIALFPSGMDKLGWTSATLMSNALRKPAQPPLTPTKILWAGPWVARWSGRDSDLFFIFCKYYFILAESFFPPYLPLVEKARAPAFVLISAQILAVLNSTLHRQAAVGAMSTPPLSDAVYGLDASAIALHMGPGNNDILKGMADNRLIALLKDMLSDVTASCGTARFTFAESFAIVMRVAIKHTSQFDHSACFTVCDFLQESLVVYNKFADSCGTPTIYVDWPFWFDVLKKILETNNSVSEIRVLSLIYSIWETIAGDQSRKESICVDWLLSEETFDRLFNNWSPMVRAYYMRLLCWRICRDAGNANESDARIFLLVFTRLKKVWSHFLWLKRHAELEGKVPPSTAPSFPTPGKRFMIIRTQIATPQPGLIAGFDSLGSPRQDMTDAPPTDFDSINTFVPEPTGTAKKTWSLLGKVFSFTANADGTKTNDLEALRRETAAARTKAAHRTLQPTTSIRPTSRDSVESLPIFEAERYLFRFVLSLNNAGTVPPPNRNLTRPRLPNPAQSWVTANGHGEKPLPMAGRPAPTRAVSGSILTGLVDSAKNADYSRVHSTPSSPSTVLDGRSSIGQLSFTELHEDDIPLRNAVNLSKENLVSPLEPIGSYAMTVKYAGRALAEWSLVVAECNGFIERRREEGVLGLQDVEVPVLGVEGFRKMG